MKKFIAILLTVILAMGSLAVLSGCKKKIENQIILGNGTELSGDFGGTFWSNNAANKDIRDMVNGYETIQQTVAGDFVWDTLVTVANHKETMNDDGTKTFQIEIKKNLTYHDGTPITAKDYICTILAFSSPVKKDAGCKATTGSSYVGYEVYSEATEPTPFSGVRLISDYIFSVTVSADYIPYYYDLLYADFLPYAPSLWLGTDVDVKDDGQGAYLTEKWYEKAEKDGEMKYVKAEQLQIARMATSNRLCAGPYRIESYDEATKTAVLTLNEKYLGNHEGQKPHIAKVIYILIDTATQMDLFKTGGVDVLQELASGAEIESGLALAKEGKAKYETYLRSGYGRLMFVCDFGPAQFLEVRQAVAYLLDTPEFSKQFTGGYGGIVYGPYGLASWMYEAGQDKLEDKINSYDYSADTVKKLLDDGGWVYNKDGSAWTGTGIRYKKIENPSEYDLSFKAGEYKMEKVGDVYYMPLALNWQGGNAEVAEIITTMLVESDETAKAGMFVNAQFVDFSILLNYLYRDASQGEQYGIPTINMFTLGMGITAVYDMAGNYATKDGPHAQYYDLFNDNKINDELLDTYSWDMVYGVEPGDKEAFLDMWLKFIIRFNEVLPDIPLYANLYHTFYNENIENFVVNPYWGPANAILYANIVGYGPNDVVED